MNEEELKDFGIYLKDLFESALDIADDAEIEQVFDDRVLVSIDRYLWDTFINAASSEENDDGL